MGPDWLTIDRAVWVLTGVVAVLLVTHIIPDSGQAVTSARAWCGAQRGQTVLVNGHTFGEHNGLHCVLDNGSLVHIPPEVLNESA